MAQCQSLKVDRSRQFSREFIRHPTDQIAESEPLQFDTQPQVPASQVDARVFVNQGGFNQVKT
jgi:hypothetical protein